MKSQRSEMSYGKRSGGDGDRRRHRCGKAGSSRGLRRTSTFMLGAEVLRCSEIDVEEGEEAKEVW